MLDEKPKLKCLECGRVIDILVCPVCQSGKVTEPKEPETPNVDVWMEAGE